MSSVPITVAHGDGIGPEIMAATLYILKEAGARIDIEEIAIGEKVIYPVMRPVSPPNRGEPSPHKGFSKSPDHYAPGRRLQLAERRCFARRSAFTPCASLRLLSPICEHKTSGNGCRDRPRK